jgi:hypothetical protein
MRKGLLPPNRSFPFRIFRIHNYESSSSPKVYSFVCSLFKDAAIASGSIASNYRIIVNNELKSIWKETVVV